MKNMKGVIFGILGLLSIIFGKMKLNSAITKAAEIRKNTKSDLEIIEDIHGQNLDEYSEEDYVNDKFIVRAKEVVGYVKVFTIPFVIFSTGVLLFVHSIAYYNVLNI